MSPLLPEVIASSGKEENGEEVTSRCKAPVMISFSIFAIGAVALSPLRASLAWL